MGVLESVGLSSLTEQLSDFVIIISKKLCASLRVSVRPFLNAVFSATAGPILTRVGGSTNLKNQDDRSLASSYKKSCSYVTIFLSVAHFSATAWPIWTKPGRKVVNVSGFINVKKSG